MSTLEDVRFSIDALRQGGAEDITLLHCTTNYPCPYEDVNLRAMLTLRDTFNLPIGYSDHTIGRDIAVAAVSLGATIIEKHFTLDCKMEGPDHLASTEPKNFADLVNGIRIVENGLGTGIKAPTSAEKQISKVVTKRIVAKREIKKGEQFTLDNLCVKRNDFGALARNWDTVLGQIALKDYIIDEGIL
jgi:N-acetylneuraminate synthase/N,N'-diacetyllegionaminate synthase